jgi:hypothetical protein
MEEEGDYNIFDEEYQRIAEDRDFIVLHDILKMNLMDDSCDHKVNLVHIRIIFIFIYFIYKLNYYKATLFFLDDDKDGRFTSVNFENLSKVYFEKEELFNNKKYELVSQLQAYFTLLMWKVNKYYYY